MKNRIRMLEG